MKYKTIEVSNIFQVRSFLSTFKEDCHPHPSQDEEENSASQEVKTAVEISTAGKRHKVASKRVDAEGRNTTEKVRKSYSWFKLSWKAIKVNQACGDEHSRREDGAEYCPNDQQGETADKRKQENCEGQPYAADYVKALSRELEETFQNSWVS